MGNGKKLAALGLACAACCALPSAGALLAAAGLAGVSGATLGWGVGLAAAAGGLAVLVLRRRVTASAGCSTATPTGCGCGSPKVVSPSQTG